MTSCSLSIAVSYLDAGADKQVNKFDMNTGEWLATSTG